LHKEGKLVTTLLALHAWGEEGEPGRHAPHFVWEVGCRENEGVWGRFKEA